MRSMDALAMVLSLLLLSSSLEAARLVPPTVSASPGGRRSSANGVASRAQIKSHLAKKDVIEHLNGLVDLNVKYVAKVVQQVEEGVLDKATANVLVDKIAVQIQDLTAKAHALEKIRDQEERRRSRRGFFAALGRFFKGASRFLGRTIGGIFYTTGKLARIAIEEIAPSLIIEEVKAIIKGKLDLLMNKIQAKIGPKAFDLLVELAKAIRRKERGEGKANGEAGKEFVLDLDEEYFVGGVAWRAFGNETAPNITACGCVGLGADLTEVSLYLEFDFEEGTVNGWISNGRVSWQDEEGLEYARGIFSATLGGTVTPTEDGKWEYEGSASLSLSIEGKAICGRIIWEDGIEYVYAEGGTEVKKVPSTFKGGSEPQMAIGGGQFHLRWVDDSKKDVYGGPSIEFEIYNPYSKPFPTEFPPVS